MNKQLCEVEINKIFVLNPCERNKQIAGEIKKNIEDVGLKRPILRGRDIKRYGYEFADLYIIATFPSKHYNLSLIHI